MHAVSNNFIVCELEHSKRMAERYVAEFEAKLQESRDALVDLPCCDAVSHNIDYHVEGGLCLRRYQIHMIETYGSYVMSMFDDDMVEAIVEGREPPDIHDLIEMVKEFKTGTMNEFIVKTIVPIDLKGTVGFVIGR